MPEETHLLIFPSSMLNHFRNGPAVASCSGIPGCTGSGFVGICETNGSAVSSISVVDGGRGFSPHALPQVRVCLLVCVVSVQNRNS